MTFKEQILRMTAASADNFVKSIRAMPADKVEWCVDGEGRSALDQFREIAQSPMWAVPLLRAKAFPEFDPEKLAEAKAERDVWDMDACEAKMRENLASFYAEARAFPDDELDKEIWLPFAGGMTQTMADIMAYPYWNIVYHNGQINFIQTLYGDKEMR